MKYLTFIIACFFLTGCDVPQETKHLMKLTLEQRLQREYFETEDIIPMYGSAELRDIEKKPGDFDGVYTVRFTYEFKDRGEDAVTLIGFAGFDKNGHLIVDVPQKGEDKIAIDIWEIIVNGTPIPSKEVNTNKYVLDCFVNRNQYNGY